MTYANLILLLIFGPVADGWIIFYPERILFADSAMGKALGNPKKMRFCHFLTAIAITQAISN